MSRNTDLYAANAHLPPSNVSEASSVGVLTGFMVTDHDKYYVGRGFCFSRKHGADVPKDTPHPFWTDESDEFCITGFFDHYEHSQPGWEEFYRLLNSFEFLPPNANL